MNTAARKWFVRRGYPLRWLPLPWVWRLKIAKAQYKVGVGIARRLCRGNRYGDHTPLWPAVQPLGGSCLCARVRRRLDYIPF